MNHFVSILEKKRRWKDVRRKRREEMQEARSVMDALTMRYHNCRATTGEWMCARWAAMMGRPPQKEGCTALRRLGGTNGCCEVVPGARRVVVGCGALLGRFFGIMVGARQGGGWVGDQVGLGLAAAVAGLRRDYCHAGQTVWWESGALACGFARASRWELPGKWPENI
jgi:hypothetical protein